MASGRRPRGRAAPTPMPTQARARPGSPGRERAGLCWQPHDAFICWVWSRCPVVAPQALQQRSASLHGQQLLRAGCLDGLVGSCPPMPDPVRLRVELFLFFCCRITWFSRVCMSSAQARATRRARSWRRAWRPGAGRGGWRGGGGARSACARWTARAATRSAAAASWSCRRAPAPGRARSAMLCQGRGQSLPRPARALCLQQLSRHPHLTS